MKVAIFGAGPCGLTAAWEMAKRGVKVTVVERDHAVGGLCKTVRRGGYQFDLGGHRFISRDQELVHDVKTLLGASLLSRKRKSVIRFKDRQFDYPIRLANVVSRSTLRMSAAFALGYLMSCTRWHESRAPVGSFEAWADKSFGRPLNEYFFKPYTEKLWGVNAGLLSDEWAGQRIAALNLGDAVLTALNVTRRTTRTHAAGYLYPEKGIGQIFEAMARDIALRGGEIITGFRPVEFHTAGSRVESAVIENENGERKIVAADEYLSTIPLDEAARMLAPEAAPGLAYRSLRFLNITLEGMSDLSTATWMYTPEADIIMTRIQEPKRRSPHSAPGGKTSVMLEIPCQYNDAVWSQPDRLLLDTALGHLLALGFDLRGRVKSVFSTYAKNAYPMLTLEACGTVGAVRSAVNRFANLKTAGRQGLFKYIFMDTAMLMGRQWARNLIGGNKERHGFETIHSEPALLEAESVAQ